MIDMIEALQFGFMRNALMAGLLVSIACGIVGTFVVINRIVFISGGIAHAAYGGIGLGYFCKFDPVLGAIVFSLAAALGMDPDNLPESDPSQMNFASGSSKPKSWKEIWGSGQGIGAVKEIVGAAELVDRLEREYLAARARLGLCARAAAAE